jgi:transcriptional regulator with XRE-family HTH domain
VRRQRHTQSWAALVTSGRSAAGLTKVDLARRIGISRNTLFRWEQGDNRPEDAGVVERTAAVLGLDLDDALIAAGLMPAAIRNPRPRPAPPHHDPDIRRLIEIFDDPATPDVVRQQIVTMIRALDALANAQPPRRRPAARRKTA